jgi:hypothetical protein
VVQEQLGGVSIDQKLPIIKDLSNQPNHLWNRERHNKINVTISHSI